MVNLKNITLIYIFFVCISFNFKWFYISGSFAYIDLLLPLLLLVTAYQKNIKLDFFFFLLSALAFITCASSLFAITSGAFDNNKIGYIFRSLYFVGLYVLIFNSNVSTENIIKVIMASLIFSLFLCFYIWTTSPRYFGFTSMPMLHVLDSPTGIKVNRNESGLYASLLFAISFYGFIYNRYFSYLTNLLIVIISFLTVALTFSKGTWILSLISILLIISYKYKPTKFFITTSILMVLFFSLPLSDLLFLDAVVTRFSGSGETNAYRFGYLVDAIYIGADNLLLGIGPGNYKEYTAANGYLITIDPHNALAQSFAELGIFGLALVLLLYASSFYQSYFNSKKEDTYIIIFVLMIMLLADSFISGLSLTMKILYILAALTMRRGLDVRKQK